MASIIEKIEDHYRICDNLKNEAELNYYHEDASWTDLEKVKIFFFKNPYLDKETNIYDIYIKDSEERVGCIFPMYLEAYNNQKQSEISKCKSLSISIF